MTVLRYIVEPDAESTRLDQFLAQRSGEAASRSQIAGWAKEGRVRVNGEPAKPALRLREGDQVELDVPAPPPVELIPQADVAFEIVHEDESLVVVDKPQGLSVHPGPGHPDGTLVNGLLGRGIALSPIGLPLRPGIVHRIDLGTSGLLVVAKTEQAHRSLAKHFAAHAVERVYLALVWGEPRQERGTIESSLARSPVNRKKFASLEGTGKRAVTHWELVTSSGQISLLRLRLETGRTHQIRVHMAEAGHSLLGDPLYGRQHPGRVSARLAKAISELPSQALHAAVLGFRHPISSSQLMRFESAPPRAFEEVRRLAIA